MSLALLQDTWAQQCASGRFWNAVSSWAMLLISAHLHDSGRGTNLGWHHASGALEQATGDSLRLGCPSLSCAEPAAASTQPISVLQGKIWPHGSSAATYEAELDICDANVPMLAMPVASRP